MPIPKKSQVEIYADDLAKQEIDPDTLDLKFFEPCPFNKTLFSITPGENGTLHKLSYSIGPDDSSLNGYILLAITRMQNVNLFATSQAQNQIIWSKIFFRGDNNSEQFLKPVYLHRGEPIYIQAISNLPAPANALGQMTLTIMPTFR